MSICKHCQLEIETADKPKGFMANHSRWCDKNPKKIGYLEKIKNKEHNPFKNYYALKENREAVNVKIKQAWKDGKYKDADFGKGSRGRHLSDKAKEKVSIGLKLAHLENRHPGWANANKINKSYPERLFETEIKNRGYFEKYNVVQQLSFSKYFFDFAFVDYKLDVEIDGCQHYRTINNIEYDKVRDNFTLSKGWKVYRISANELQKNTKQEVDKLEEFIANQLEYRIYDINELNSILNKHIAIYGSRKDYNEVKTRLYKESQLKYIELILNSDIDFSKFGWVGKSSKILERTPQQVNKWMKKFMPDFYNKNCFKRN